MPITWCLENLQCPEMSLENLARECLQLSCTRLRVSLSRYTCRATRVAADFLDFIALCRCSTGVALHPLKILVSHLPPPPLCREVSHRNLGLRRCRATRGCRSLQLRVSRYTVQLRSPAMVARHGWPPLKAT